MRMACVECDWRTVSGVSSYESSRDMRARVRRAAYAEPLTSRFK